MIIAVSLAPLTSQGPKHVPVPHFVFVLYLLVFNFFLLFCIFIHCINIYCDLILSTVHFITRWPCNRLNCPALGALLCISLSGPLSSLFPAPATSLSSSYLPWSPSGFAGFSHVSGWFAQSQPLTVWTPKGWLSMAASPPFGLSPPPGLHSLHLPFHNLPHGPCFLLPPGLTHSQASPLFDCVGRTHQALGLMGFVGPVRRSVCRCTGHFLSAPDWLILAVNQVGGFK